MEQSPSWEAYWCSASQEIPCILCNLKVHYRIHKCPPPVPILSQVWGCLHEHFVTRYGFMVRRLKDHPFSAVRDCLFNIFVATLHIGGHSPFTTWGHTMPWWQGPNYHLSLVLKRRNVPKKQGKKLQNKGLHGLYFSPDTTMSVKTRRMWGHVTCMGQKEKYI